MKGTYFDPVTDRITHGIRLAEQAGRGVEEPSEKQQTNRQENRCAERITTVISPHLN
jgi:hypothetical protein